MMVCMVSAISTLPAMLIVGGLQPPTIVNYYYTTNPTNTTTTNTTIVNTNTTIYVNGTYLKTTPHFVNVTATIPYTASTGESSLTYTTIYSIPLVNRSIVKSMVVFSFNRRPSTGGTSNCFIYSRLNGERVSGSCGFPSIVCSTLTNEPLYSVFSIYPFDGTTYPNATSYTLDICGNSGDATWPNLNVSVSIWWETW
jgi:hypothetical protein